MNRHSSIDAKVINCFDAATAANCNLIRFLSSMFAEADIIEAVKKYQLSATDNPEEVIFWQTDIEGNLHTGKVMSYSSIDGKRLKDINGGAVGINWIHHLLIDANILPEDYIVKQCFFGEHLLKGNDKVVGVVESEKTAVICSIVYPDKVWLATSGKENLKSKLPALEGRKVVFHPDADGFFDWRKLWRDIAKVCSSFSIDSTCRNLAEDNPTFAHYDLADIIISERQGQTFTIEEEQMNEEQFTTFYGKQYRLQKYPPLTFSEYEELLKTDSAENVRMAIDEAERCFLPTNQTSIKDYLIRLLSYKPWKFEMPF